MMNHTKHHQIKLRKFHLRNKAIITIVYRILASLVTAILFVACLPIEPIALAEDGNKEWVTTWSTALHEPSPGPPGLTNTGFNNQTLRQIVHTSIGGDRARVRLSTFGASALVVGSAHIGLRDSGAAIIPASDRTLTFGGQSSITIPPGASVLSDAVDLDIPALSDVAVSVFLPATTGPATWHFAALQTSYISPPGDFTGAEVMPVASTTQAWFWLAGVEVTTTSQTGAIAILGDSVTEGTRSTPNTNNRWPDHLARRLLVEEGNHKLGVLNEGIAGNKLMNHIIGPNGLSRFDRDVLTQTAVTHVTVLLGNNDLLFVFSPTDVVTVDQIIAGHKQLIRRAHARGLKIYGGTLTPFDGFFFSSALKEEARQAINAWIRTSGEYDAVIDFDEVLRDPSFPSRLLPIYDSGDHLHPNDAGYQAMANAINLKLFKNVDDQ
jgi:lysophospholipase L1-like esterase